DGRGGRRGARDRGNVVEDGRGVNGRSAITLDTLTFTKPPFFRCSAARKRYDQARSTTPSPHLLRGEAMPRTLTCLALCLFALACLALPGSAADKDKDGLVPLFNGKNLDGWEQRNGTAKYSVEGDCIVGKTNEGSPNSFLCTVKEYSDFELKFEVK